MPDRVSLTKKLPKILKNLKPEQREAIMYLSAGATFREAAKKAGVSEMTLYNWRQKKDFQKAIKLAQAYIVETKRFEIAKVHGKAIRLMEKIIDDEKASMRDRLSAARAMLEHWVKVEKMASQAEYIEETADVVSDLKGLIEAATERKPKLMNEALRAMNTAEKLALN